VPLVPVAPAVRMPVAGGFGAVAIDAPRRRVYAAHANDLIVIDADTRTLLATIPAGSPRGVAVDPLSGNVFTGSADGTIAERDPRHGTVVRSLQVDGPVDRLDYDAELGRLYAGGAGGTRLWIVDVRTFAGARTLVLDGRKPAGIAIDPQTHDVYANAGDAAHYAMVDPAAASILTTIPTPDVTGNGPLAYDPAFGQVVTVGANGVLAVYDRAGVQHAELAVPAGITSCDLDRATHVLACAAPDRVAAIQLVKNRVPFVSETDSVEPGPRTIATDAKTHARWMVWSRPGGDADMLEVAQFTPAGGSPNAPNSVQSP
jgi:YVTN family beta-propeller protein